MPERYDAIVIGAGPSGEVAAGDLANHGLRVAAVERELVGGECGFWACIPSKTLLRPGDVLSEAGQAPGAREAVDGSLDVRAALSWRDFEVSNYDDHHQADWLSEMKVDILRGQARLDGPGRVRVGDELYETDRVVVATGSDPVIPPVDGLAELEGLWTNREATGLKEVPESMLTLGGGPVGVEMGQVLRRMGARVTIVEHEGRLLSREARPVGEAVAEALASQGVELRLGRAATAARHADGGFELDLDDGSTERAEKLLVATGRKPRIDDLGLESVGIEPGKRGIEVDERMRAGEGVWAIGDATGKFLFTHVGKYQARIAVADILGKPAHADYRAVPRVVFTDPEVAAVGATEGERTARAELANIARTSTYTREYDQNPGFLELVADGDRLTGAYAVGPQAGEWMQQITLAIRAEMPLDVLRDVIQPFPTFSEVVYAALKQL
ncbi:MAG TPA: NAD(P)/FAD-dependent oxidoreductase [Thermoleophilaceae bacterium]